MNTQDNYKSSFDSLIGFTTIHKTLGKGIVTRVNEDCVHINFERDKRELKFLIETFLHESEDYFSHSLTDLNAYECECESNNKYKKKIPSNESAQTNNHEKITYTQEDLDTFIESINETLVCILVHDKTSNTIEIDSVPIDNSLVKCINDFITLCKTQNTTVEELIKHLETETDLNKLTGEYKYCHSLRDPYQGVSARNYFFIDSYKKIKEIMDELEISKQEINSGDEQSMKNYLSNKNNNDVQFENLKKLCVIEYPKWGQAYAINKTYRKCYDRKDILTFSHRLRGWSNPVYKLSENFSVEIKTNFGYGKSSYFFTKLKFKNIEIIPFSEWILYQHVNVSEIVRYTKRHRLENISWYEAMTFAKTACNLSITDEEKFILEYVIRECEKMVSGLEEIFSNDSFILTTKMETIHKVDMNGRVLVEFRGEKISGALDFISSIIDYQGFIEISDFIYKIELVNKKIQPILAYELMHVADDIKENEVLYGVLYNELISLKKKNDDYLIKLKLIKDEIYKNKPFDINFISLIDEDHADAILELKNCDPEYKIFLEVFEKLQKDIKENTQIFENLKFVQQKIKSYVNKITMHFLKKDEFTF